MLSGLRYMEYIHIFDFPFSFSSISGTKVSTFLNKSCLLLFLYFPTLLLHNRTDLGRGVTCGIMAEVLLGDISLLSHKIKLCSGESKE